MKIYESFFNLILKIQEIILSFNQILDKFLTTSYINHHGSY